MNLYHSIRSLFLLLLLLAGNSTFATHIVGGEIVYKHLGSNNYRISLSLYVDCINGTPGAIELDKEGLIGVFGVNNNFIRALPMQRSQPSRVAAKNYGCVVPPVNACVDFYYFETNVNLPPIAGGYTLAFQRCCRNGTISNIITPGDVGATYFTKIPDVATHGYNNSPKFKDLPPNFLCTDEPLDFNHVAIDDDGDSLVYELCTPYNGGDSFDPLPHPATSTPPYTNIAWRGIYNLDNQMGGKPILAVDEKTGQMTVTPTITGQFVVGVCVSEYRKGVLINKTLRDFQFNVLPCVFNIKARFGIDMKLCTRSVDFNNLTSGSPEYFRWDFGVPGMDADTSRSQTPSFTFPGPGEYTVTLEAGTSTCKNTYQSVVVILPDKIELLNRDTIVCYQHRVEVGVKDTDPRMSYAWSPSADLDNPAISNPTTPANTTKWLSVKKSSPTCFIYDTVQVITDDLRVDFTHQYLPPCDGLKVVYEQKATGATSYSWDFGDPSTDLDVAVTPSATWYYQDSGIIYVKFKASNLRCTDSVTKPIRIIFPDIFTIRIDSNICEGDLVKIGPASDTSILSFTWDPVDKLDDPALLYPTVNTIISKQYVLTKEYKYCTRRDTFFIRVNKLPNMKVTRTGLDTICPGDTVQLSVTGDFDFQWTPAYRISDPTIKDPLVWPDTTTTYKVVATNLAGCSSSDTVSVGVHQLYYPNLATDTVLCPGQSLVFNSKLMPNMRNHSWSDASEIVYDSVTKEGKYYLMVANACQVIRDTVNVFYFVENHCEYYLPNAFSPNRDQYNETYPFNGKYDEIYDYSCDFTDFELLIFDRWGGIIFRTNNPRENWDGNHKSTTSTIDVYGYYVRYRLYNHCLNNFEIISKKGNITLMR